VSSWTCFFTAYFTPFFFFSLCSILTSQGALGLWWRVLNRSKRPGFLRDGFLPFRFSIHCMFPSLLEGGSANLCRGPPPFPIAPQFIASFQALTPSAFSIFTSFPLIVKGLSSLELRGTSFSLFSRSSTSGTLG